MATATSIDSVAITRVANVRDGHGRGWSFTPLRGKVPTRRAWTKAPRETLEEALVWAAAGNVGLRTGKASGVFVIDVDPGGDAAALDLPPTVTAMTGRGGTHLYFVHPGHLGNSAGRLGPHIDTRGDGGQVVFPGSIHPDTGASYEWVAGSEPWTAALAALPAAVLKRLKPSPARPATSTSRPSAVLIPAYAMAAWRGEQAAVRAAPVGERNATLNTAALKLGQLVGAGALARQDVEVALRDAARDVGLEDREIAATIRSGIEAGIADPRQATPRPSATPRTVAKGEVANPCAFHTTDSGNAEALAALYGHRLRYDYRQRRWLLYRGHSWHSDADGAIDRLALEAARARLRAAADLTDTDEQTRQTKWGIRSESAERRAAALSLARSERPIADGGVGWDADPWLLGVSNGVVDLRTGTLRDGKSEDRITLALPWPYDPSAKCPRWERFNVEIFNDDADLVDFVHRAVGCTVSGSTREQVWFLLHGGGANGKTTFLQVLRYLFGPLAINTPFATFELSPRQPASNDLAALASKRLVTSAETRENARLNEARIKNLTGGDTMTARFLYQEFFEFEPACKIWLAVNHRPRVGDDSEGFWRRMREIPFTRQFLGDEADEDLILALKAEVEGILAWCVRGAAAWQERSLKNPPACVTAAVAEYRAASDPLADFLSECCVVGDNCEAASADLYRVYGEWAKANGLTDRERLKRTGFGRRMGDRFERFKPGRQGWYYRGVGLRA